VADGTTSTLSNPGLSFADSRDVDVFVETLDRFERGELSADQWRSFRLLNGTYGQRQEGELSMVRAKIPQGALSADQLVAVADVADRFSRGFCHITTRQNFQFHFVPLEQVGEAMYALARAGITTKEACGNAVRNVTTSPTAGVADDELFDVTPYASALTRFFLRRPIASSLPRKFKIAFSGGGRDHSFALVNDIGFEARITEAGARAFRVTVGGGTALMCQGGQELFASLPAVEILCVAEAVARVFQARGDRVNRKKNRMKFLMKQIGWDTFRALVLEAYEQVRAEETPTLGFDPESPPRQESAPASRSLAPTTSQLDALVMFDRPRGPGITPKFLSVVGDPDGARFLRTNVRAQSQSGHSVVMVVVPLGDLSSGRLRALAALSRAFSDGTVRTTIGQNLLLRWVPNHELRSLYSLLKRIGLAEPDPESIADVGSCPGAESCKLAVTQSRGLADLLGARFKANRSLVDRAPGVSIRVSGCPNGCGLHHVSTLGFQGGLRKIDGRPVPQYHVYAGGDLSGSDAKFGRIIGKVTARRIPDVVERLIGHYESRRSDGESMTQFLARAPVAELRSAISDLEKLDASSATAEDYVDLGETQSFKPATTEGECVA